ncbi:MAG: hypothetical protein LBP98_06705 [Tannerella sp.]|jgi:hypothetical protein|nr:hypothetical protein [Tannerella sp.]
MKRTKYIGWLTGLLLGVLTGCMENVTLDADVKNAKAPELTGIGESTKTASSITVKASVTSANGYEVTERGFCWGTGETLERGTDNFIQVGAGVGEFSATIENLLGNTKYYVRPYAINQVNIAYGEQKEIDTNSGLGSVRTFASYDIHATTAVCGGVIGSPGEGSIRERGIYVSSSADMTANRDSVPSAMEADSFICNVSRLRPLSRYYVQAYVKNTFGSFTGSIDSFTTTDGRPKMDTVSIIDHVNSGYTDVTVFSAILELGDAMFISRGFFWSESPMLDTASILRADSIVTTSSGPNTNLQFVGQLENLKPKTKYYVRSFAKNEFGMGFSPEKEFYTKSEMPTIETLLPEATAGGTVILRGKLIDRGKTSVTSSGICYSATLSDPELENGGNRIDVPLDASQQIRIELSGWKGGTIYYVRMFATNEDGTSYGNVEILETPRIFGSGLAAFPGAPLIQGSPTYFSIGDRAFLLGGDLGSAYSDKLWSYDNLNGEWKWSPLASYSFLAQDSLKWQAAATYDTNVYLLGGFNSAYEPQNLFMRYNTSSNMWYIYHSPGPDSAYSRVGFQFMDKACFLGGRKDTAKNEVWAFEVFPPNVWSRKADFPAAQYGGMAVNIEGTIYAGLGKNTDEVCNKQLWKSSDLDLWTEEPSCPAITNGILAGVAFNGNIYVIDEAYYIIEYNPSTQLWRVKSRLPANNRNIHCMYVLNGAIYIGLGMNSLITYNPSWDN